MKNKLFNELKEKGYFQEYYPNEIREIEISAKKYFECDVDKLKECKDTDYCLININFENESAEYCWLSENMNPGNGIYINDDFNGVCELIEELLLEENIDKK